MLLPGADPAQALITAQNCMQRMQQEAIAHAASPTAPLLTCSIGLASTQPDVDVDPDALVNAADAAMYRAKANGRARYEAAQQADWNIGDDTPRTRNPGRASFSF